MIAWLNKNGELETPTKTEKDLFPDGYIRLALIPEERGLVLKYYTPNKITYKQYLSILSYGRQQKCIHVFSELDSKEVLDF